MIPRAAIPPDVLRDLEREANDRFAAGTEFLARLNDLREHVRPGTNEFADVMRLQMQQRMANRALLEVASILQRLSGVPGGAAMEVPQ